MRIANLEEVQPAALQELNEIMEKQFAGQAGTQAAKMGGLKSAANIMNYLDTAIEGQLMDAIREQDEEMSQQIQDLMFVFDNLVDVDDKGIQAILREVQQDALLKAIKGADEELKDKIMRNMSKRAAEMLNDDLEALGPVRISEVETAQKEILSVARRLSDSGEIMLGGGGGEEFLQERQSRHSFSLGKHMTAKKSFSENEVNEAKKWDLPFVDDPTAPRENEPTNALNKRSDWQYEPPEVEEEIQPPTAEEIEAIRQAAYDEGYQEGKEKGFEEGKAQGLEAGLAEGKEQGHTEGLEQGLEEGRQQMTAQAEVWQMLAEKFHDPLSQANDETRDQLVKLAVTLAKAVIKTEVSTNQQVIMQALSEGIKALPINQADYQIHMNPEDIELVKEHFGEEEITKKGWNLVEAPAMERGGCDITTAQNAVDVSIERRCRDVIDRFLLNQGLSNDQPLACPF